MEMRVPIRVPTLLCILLCSAALTAQESAPIRYGSLSTIVVEDFDSQPAWGTEPLLSPRTIHIETRFLPGMPLDMIAIDGEDQADQPFVLGVKMSIEEVDYYRIHVRPEQPIELSGVVKTISVWVHGQNIPHRLSIALLDPDREALGTLRLGGLNFLGWQCLTAALSGLPVNRGLFFNGFVIECGPMHVYREPLYYYFDRISTVTDEWVP